MTNRPPLEKILTISAKDYCEMYDKNLNQYTAQGVHSEEKDVFRDGFVRLENFRFEIPSGTEVIVDFQHSIGFETESRLGSGTSTMHSYAYGTALIPKKE